MLCVRMSTDIHTSISSFDTDVMSPSLWCVVQIGMSVQMFADAREFPSVSVCVSVCKGGGGREWGGGGANKLGSFASPSSPWRNGWTRHAMIRRVGSPVPSDL